MKFEDIKKVACIGSGLIGSSWATLFARYGYEVHMYDVSKDALDNCISRIRNNFEIYQEAKVMTKKEVNAAVKRVSLFEDLESAIKDVQLMQESISERLELKQQMLAEIDKYNQTAIYCSSTSRLNISDIAANSKYISRCMVGHPFNPPHLMPLVEMAPCPKTDKDLVEAARDFYEAMGKETVVLKKEYPGFIGNSLQHGLVKQAIQVVMDGVCSIEDVDKVAVYGLGIRWAIVGPNLNGELNGGDGGIHKYFEQFRPNSTKAYEAILASKIKEVPHEYSEKIGPEGVAEELKNRTPEQGKTRDEVIAYRDKMLIDILRLHKKL